MSKEITLSTYRIYAPVYYFVFGAIFQPGRRYLQAKMACEAGEKVLEVGVGTGMSLVQYPDGVNLTGVDFSHDMLKVARQRVERAGRRNVKLLQMDAQAMRFPDGSFDKVVAAYVASVVQDPSAMLREMRRVCKKGGDIYILNHFNRGAFWEKHELLLKPFTPALGWNTPFYLKKFLQEPGLENAVVEPVQAWGYWSLVHAKNV